MEKKKIVVLDEYYNMKERTNTLVTDRRLDDYAQEIYDWALNDQDALKVTQFYAERGINTETWSRWMAMHKGLSEAYQTALVLIGNRRENGAIKRKFAEGIVCTSMHRYDPEWRKSEEWRATLRQEKKDQNETKYILIGSLDELETRPTPEEVGRRNSMKHPKKGNKRKRASRPSLE